MRRCRSKARSGRYLVQSPTGAFCADKRHKKPPKPLRFRTSRLFLVFNATRRQTSAPTNSLGRLLSLLPTERGHRENETPPPQGTPKQRHRLINQNSVAGERGNRSAFRCTSCRKETCEEEGGLSQIGDTQGACPWENFWVLLFLYKSTPSETGTS